MSVKRNSVQNTEIGAVNFGYEAGPGDNSSTHKQSISGDKNAIAVEETGEKAKDRASWGNPMEFLMSCIAMSVGFGNVWRFPFTAYDNGGGAFLIPYIIVLFVIGKPMYFMEMGLGQFTSYSAVKSWNMAPAMKGIGWGMVLVTFTNFTFYTSLMAITVFYLIASFSAELPWSVCDPAWGPNCFDSKPSDNENPGNYTGMRSSSELYFIKEVLKEYDNIDNGIGAPEWRLTLCLLFSWIVIFLVISRGIKTSGKAVYFLALFPYVVLIVLLIRGCTLPGADKGILYFITPQWEKLIDPGVWYAAITQAFFSLSVSFGAIIMYSSYNKFDHNIRRDVFVVTTMDTFTSLLAGVTIFSIIGNLAYEMGIDDIGSVVQGGSGLAFISYPDAIAKFDVVPQLFAVIFFLMLFSLGTGSSVALASTIIVIICDQFKQLKQWLVTLVVCIVGFLVALIFVTPGGQWMLTLVDHYCVTYVVFILAVGEMVTIAWIYGMSRFSRDLQFMLGTTLGWYWRVCWAILTPALLIVVFIYSSIVMEKKKYNDMFYPEIAYTFAWIFASISMAQIPVWICVAWYKRRHFPLKEMLLDAFRPNKEWGPKDPQHRQDWLEYKQRKSDEDAARNDRAMKRIGKNLGGCGETN